MDWKYISSQVIAIVVPILAAVLAVRLTANQGSLAISPLFKARLKRTAVIISLAALLGFGIVFSEWRLSISVHQQGILTRADVAGISNWAATSVVFRTVAGLLIGWGVFQRFSTLRG